MSKVSEQDELLLWLEEMPLSKPRKNLARDFSDGVLMAEVLKYLYPKMVELHNYTPANCLMHKMNNWCTLDRKVLAKLGLKLSKNAIEQIASAVPDAVSPLLMSLRQKVVRAQQKREDNKQKNCISTQSTLCFVQDKKQAEAVFGIPMAYESTKGQQLIVSMENMVPQRLLDEKVTEISEKDEAINILIQKVSHLDTLLQLKDQRIKDLSQQLQYLQERSKENGKTNFQLDS